MFRFSVLPAISLDSMIDCMVVKGAFNTELFTTFIERLLDKMNPFPGLQSVLIMDNCSIHKVSEICKLIESRSALYPFSQHLANLSMI